jgi:hypothetical protein
MPGVPLGPLGRPPVQYSAGQLDIKAIQGLIDAAASQSEAAQQRLLEEILMVAPAAIPFLRPAAKPPLGPVQGTPVVWGPGGFTAPKFGFAAPPPSVPASQPFGVMPGSGLAFNGGSTMPSFPVTNQASFPPNPFVNALLGGGGAPVQPVGLAGSVMKQLPGFLGGIAGGELFESLVATGGAGGTPMFRPTMAGARAQFFRTQNPATGQDTWFRPAGRPILWSGDLTACKRVKKVARRAARKR